MTPFLIGIAGPSCAGKTELASALAAWLPGHVPVVSLDSYYRPLDHLTLEERAATNFDHPDALDWELIIRDTARLAGGERIDEPVNLFDRHTRASHARGVEAAPYMIVEGLFTFHREEVRARLQAKYFVIAPMDVCLARRRRRDVAERGRTPESVDKQFNDTVRPMAEQFVLPTRAYADLVLSGEMPMEESTAMARNHLRELTGTRAMAS